MYERPALTVDVVVFTGSDADTRVLLIKRANEPYIGAYALPGGFVDPYEIPVQAALRECLEETNLKLDHWDLTPLTLRAKKGRDPRGWTVTQPYSVYLANAPDVKAGDDAHQAEWVLLNELDDLAFDHGAILCDALSRHWPLFHGAGESKRLWSVPPAVENPLFFGGSFNPWHEGHDACLQLASDATDRELVVVPDRSPFKPDQERGCDWAHFRHINKQTHSRKIHVFPGFLASELGNPTYGWLPKMASRNRQFLMGADSFINLRQWTNALGLIGSMTAIYVVPRQENAYQLEQAKDWVKANSSCRIIELPHHSYESISSTAIRSKQHHE